MPNEACHAACLRLAARVPAEAIAERLALTTSGSLWIEDVPALAADPLAVHRLSAELTRPTAELRCVLLRYHDGQADLTIVAQRALLSRAGLHDLMSILVGRSPIKPLIQPRPPAKVTVAPAPDWGLATPDEQGAAHHEFPLAADQSGDLAGWLTALAVTIHRYGSGPTSSVTIGTNQGAIAISLDGTLAQLAARQHVEVDLPVVAGFLTDDELGTLTMEDWHYLPCLAPPFPLTFSVLPLAGGSSRLRCDYLRSHVSPAISGQFCRHLLHVHRQVLDDTSSSACDVELLDATEQSHIASLGRPASRLDTLPCCVHETFSRIEAVQPDAVAVVDGEARLTYRQLNQRSDRLANGLRAEGVRAGQRIAVCLEPSAELIVTILGILKAGASYVPMDPAYPADRLTFAVEDAGLGVVVTTVPDFPRTPGTVLVTPAELIAARDTGTPEPGAGPDDPAYVIYTSGSTGKPKGVVVTHRNVVSLIDATRREYEFSRDDVWTLFHSASFDFSVWEIWGCLLTGGRLVILPYSASRDPAEFRDLLVTQGVSVLSQTPSAFAGLLSVDHSELAVRLLFFGGEPLDTRTLLPWFDQHPESDCRVVNMFGITETTVHATQQTVTRGAALAASRSVGSALPGWYFSVKDQAGRTVPCGVSGEIHVGGAGVALGYLGRDDLTAQRFLPDPGTSGRVYRSGDRGRLLPDGTLEHLGRLDSQVKVRGFRIELGEIRAVLQADPVVSAAAVHVRRSDERDAATSRIDAYLVLRSGTVREVRQRVADILPEYMLPATMTALDTLPLTLNGKVDYTILPPPAQTVGGPALLPVADGGIDELVRLWSDVLDLPIAPDDDFFELGGNSLLAVRICARLRSRGFAEFRLRDLYLHSTVRSMAAILTKRTHAEAPTVDRSAQARW